MLSWLNKIPEGLCLSKMSNPSLEILSLILSALFARALSACDDDSLLQTVMDRICVIAKAKPSIVSGG